MIHSSLFCRAPGRYITALGQNAKGCHLLNGCKKKSPGSVTLQAASRTYLNVQA